MDETTYAPLAGTTDQAERYGDPELLSRLEYDSGQLLSVVFGLVCLAGSKLDALKRRIFYGSREAVHFHTGYASREAVSVARGSPREIHYAIGIATEGIEILDEICAAVNAGRDLDRVNLVEELGDVLWYLTRMADALGVSMDEIRAANIRKLRARFPDGFSEADALNRDRARELAALEGADHGG